MGQLGPFFLFLPVFGGFLLPVGVLWGVMGGLGGFGVAGWRFGLSGRANADSKGYCRCCGAAVCLVGRCPCGEAVGEDFSAGRLVTFGPGRSGGFFGLGSFDPDGFFEVVGDG